MGCNGMKLHSCLMGSSVKVVPGPLLGAYTVDTAVTCEVLQGSDKFGKTS